MPITLQSDVLPTHLTVAFDVSLDEDQDTFIPEGTIVTVYPHSLYKDDNTDIVYQGERIRYMNSTFLELAE